MFEEFEMIHSYSRKQAIEDGILLDVSDWASQIGFKWPVAISDALWSEFIDVPGIEKLGQSIRFRVIDLLNTIRAKAVQSDKPTVMCNVAFLMALGKREVVTVKSVAGPGDDGEPVITIMLMGED